MAICLTPLPNATTGIHARLVEVSTDTLVVVAADFLSHRPSLSFASVLKRKNCKNIPHPFSGQACHPNMNLAGKSGCLDIIHPISN